MAAVCSYCYENTTGDTCPRCGAPFCSLHVPLDKNERCCVCQPQTPGSASPTRTQKRSSQPKPTTPAPTMYYQPSQSVQVSPRNTSRHVKHQPAAQPVSAARPPKPTLPNLEHMTYAEVYAYVQERIHKLEAKQKRELAYLERRHARKVDTPTDEAYRNDQVLEDEILYLLGCMLQAAAHP